MFLFPLRCSLTLLLLFFFFLSPWLDWCTYNDPLSTDIIIIMHYLLRNTSDCTLCKTDQLYKTKAIKNKKREIKGWPKLLLQCKYEQCIIYSIYFVILQMNNIKRWINNNNDSCDTYYWHGVITWLFINTHSLRHSVKLKGDPRWTPWRRSAWKCLYTLCIVLKGTQDKDFHAGWHENVVYTHTSHSFKGDPRWRPWCR